MTDTRCVVCGRPMADQAYACDPCGIQKAHAQLQQIADTTPAARDVAHGLSRRGEGGGGTGKPGSRLPLDLGATSKLDAVQNELTTIVRHIAAERGLVPPWVTSYDDPIIACARFITEHLEWLRHTPECDETLTAIAASARVLAGVARGPVAQRYLGPCGAVQPFGSCDNPYGEGDCKTCDACDGDVYARQGASVGRCRVCGAEVSTGERQAWLDGLVRSQAFRAAEIAGAYGVNVNTIRSWALRGQLAEHGRDRDDRPLYLVGAVLDLAAADAARRAEEQAKRARRRENAA